MWAVLAICIHEDEALSGGVLQGCAKPDSKGALMAYVQREANEEY